MNRMTLILLLVVAVAIARLVPHPFGFTPIGAFALFAGAYVTDRRFVLLPLVALLLGDLVMGFYSLLVMVCVYLGFAASAAIGRIVLAKERTPMRFLGGVVGGAITFYLISNVGMWWVAYPQTIAGLVTCWFDGWPFLLRTMSGDFVYGVLIFGIVEWHQRTQNPGYAR